MSTIPIMLIFTYAEHGQANVNLATAYELALSGVNVCIASFASLESRVSRLQELVVRHASRASGKHTGSVSFRECNGFTPWREAVLKHSAKNSVSIGPHPHGVSGALQSYTMLEVALFPWSPEEYLSAIESCKEIIATIKPDVVAVDTLFSIAQDACKLANQRFAVISPVSIKDLALNKQPHLAALWKYPVLSSGFPFPLKWWQIPLNIYLSIRLAIQFGTSTRISEIRALRRSLGLQGSASTLRHPGIKYICASLTEIDFPFAVIPEVMLLCGPIIMPFDPVEESDPVLTKWLDNGPTVMINLGSHALSGERAPRDMASAFRMLLDHHDRTGDSRMQVLWKTMAKDAVIEEIVGKEMKAGRVKVVSWMDAEPVSILQHPNVICTVHHGGANSFYEGVWSGIPHIALPAWHDTYDYANCTEFLNIGIFGNKTCAPDVQTEEFGKALVRITGDTEEAAKFRRSAKELKEVCREKGSGRELASMEILREAGIKM